MFGGIRERLLPSLCMGVLLAAAAVAGCGGDDDEPAANSAKDQPKFTAASEPEDVFAERVAKLIETTSAKGDCKELDEINGRSLSRLPCPAPKELRTSMASFEVVDAQAYGTGAVVDYKSGEAKDGAAILLFAAPDRNWGISRFGIITTPSVGTDDAKSRAGYDRAVDRYLRAVRERDCKAFKDVAFTSGGGKDVCKTTFATTKLLGKRLRENPSAKPDYQGGNATYGFYSLETREPGPENLTISVIKGAGGAFRVLDGAPSPTAAEQRDVVRQFERQQKNGDSTTEPSSKPSDPSVKP